MVKENVVVIIQARFGSTRLPGKIFLDIGGKTMLERVIERTRKAERISGIVIATTTEDADDKTASLAEMNGVPYFRGSENNVLERYHEAAVKFNVDQVVRITSDCPVIDPQIIDKVIAEHLKSRADYTSNTVKRSYPRGWDVEILRIDALRKAYKAAREKYEIEHVTPFIYEHNSEFKIRNVEAEAGLNRPDLRLCVDEMNDLKLVREIYDRLGVNFTGLEIIKLLETEPALASINQNIKQKLTKE